MSLFKKKKETEPDVPLPPAEPTKPTEIIESEISDKPSKDHKVDPSWLGVVSPEEVASSSDAEFKANQLNLLFSIFNEMRDLRRDLKELQ